MSAIPTDVRVTQSRVFLSEWTKLRSLRSTKIVLLLAIVFTIGFAALVSGVVSTRAHHAADASSNALQVELLLGVFFAEFAIGILGVLSISGEYSTGMIRSSFSAVPKRLPVLWAKIGVYAAVTLVLMVPTILVAFFLSQWILSAGGLSISIGAGGVVRVLFGAVLYLTVTGIFAMGWGAITRNTAAGIATFVGIMLVIPILLNLLRLVSVSWYHAVSPYMPSNAGQQIMYLTKQSDMLSPWLGFAVFCAWTVVIIAIATVLLVRRDT